MERYVVGIDYGTDSARALIVNPGNGDEIASAVHSYSRWGDGKFCKASENVFRQHPADYIEALESSVKAALKKAGASVASKISGIAVDTTGSTPVAVDKECSPLSLKSEFRNDPDAMFILWKDHSSVREAEEINALAHSGKFTDYTKYCGGTYSSEWFWAKILHTIRVNKKVADAAYSWLEHCDWIPALLTGCKDCASLPRSRCAAGHKAMWHKEFGGLPSDDFLKKLDPRLAALRKRLYSETACSDRSAGVLSPEWAARLGIKSKDVAVAVGAFDAHMGAVGGGIKEGALVKIIGTSTCDMIIAPMPKKEKLIRGICGQVDGSIIPGMLGLEAGQSAFGDFYAWFRNVLAWPLRNADTLQSKKSLETIEGEIIAKLSDEAKRIPLEKGVPLFTDWINGRRTPFADQTLKASACGFEMGSGAPEIFRGIVEATAFGSRRILECFTSQGVDVREIIALGGIAKKSPFVMQTLASTMNMPVKVVKSEQACALGAAVFASVASGIHPNVGEAQRKMAGGFEKTYRPEKKSSEILSLRYERYLKLAEASEKELKF